MSSKFYPFVNLLYEKVKNAMMFLIVDREGFLMTAGFNLNEFLAKAISTGASDIHLRVNERPVIRKDGKIIKIDMPKLTEEELNSIVQSIIPRKLKTQAGSAFDLDLSRPQSEACT